MKLDPTRREELAAYPGPTAGEAFDHWRRHFEDYVAAKIARWLAEDSAKAAATVLDSNAPLRQMSEAHEYQRGKREGAAEARVRVEEVLDRVNIHDDYVEMFRAAVADPTEEKS